MRTKSEERKKIKTHIENILRKERGKAVPLETLRFTIFGAEENQWKMFCQKLIISHHIREIRDTYSIYIASFFIKGLRGYKIVETDEEFAELIGRGRESLAKISERLDKLKRDRRDGNYKNRVEKFFKGGHL
jgi:hypothetical protein